MKHLLYILLIVYFTSPTSASAQDTLPVLQSEMLMSLGTHNGFTVIIPQAQLKTITSAWKKYIKRGETKPSVEEVDGEFIVRRTSLTDVSAQPMNVYAQIKDQEKSIRLTAYFTEDDSNFISSATDPTKAHAAEKLVRNFGQMEYRLAVEQEVQTENKKLADMESQKEELIKTNEKYQSTIGENERKIDHAKVEIEANSTAQGKRRSDVAGQKEVVRVTTKKTETYDLEEKKLNSLEKELKKLEKDGENMHDDIDGWKKDNSQMERNIEKNEDLIKEKKNAIETQKDHIKDVQAKLERIK